MRGVSNHKTRLTCMFMYFSLILKSEDGLRSLEHAEAEAKAAPGRCSRDVSMRRESGEP